MTNNDALLYFLTGVLAATATRVLGWKAVLLLALFAVAAEWLQHNNVHVAVTVRET